MKLGIFKHSLEFSIFIYALLISSQCYYQFDYYTKLNTVNWLTTYGITKYLKLVCVWLCT